MANPEAPEVWGDPARPGDAILAIAAVNGRYRMTGEVHARVVNRLLKEIEDGTKQAGAAARALLNARLAEERLDQGWARIELAREKLREDQLDHLSDESLVALAEGRPQGAHPQGAAPAAGEA